MEKYTLIIGTAKVIRFFNLNQINFRKFMTPSPEFVMKKNSEKKIDEFDVLKIKLPE
jgi:hypothetical protein